MSDTNKRRKSIDPDQLKVKTHNNACTDEFIFYQTNIIDNP